MAVLQATTISGSMLLTGSLQRVNQSVSIDGNYTASIDLSDSDNFIFNASGSYAFEFVAPTSSIGQSGTIIINNNECKYKRLETIAKSERTYETAFVPSRGRLS